MEPPTVISQFDHVASLSPRKTAIFWGTERIRYDELRSRITTYAAILQRDAVVVPGTRVGILLKNSPEFIFALYAALQSGATVVPINTFLKVPEIQHIVDDCGLKCLITDDSFTETTSRLQCVQLISPQQLGATTAAQPAWPAVQPSDLALIIYTSGTTGKSKGAMLTHANIAPTSVVASRRSKRRRTTV